MKDTYRIPADLDTSPLNLEIAIQNKEGLGLKPLPIKVILSYVASAVVLFWLYAHTFIGTGTIGQMVLFGIVWVGLTIILTSYDKTRRMNVQTVATLVDYIPKANRHIITRRSSPANEFMHIVGINAINENGLIEFGDGGFGYLYRITGSASILLFEDDKSAIVSRVDAFFRKIGTNCDINFITVKEPQQVYRQVAALKRKYDSLTLKDPELMAIAEDQFDTLNNYVGQEFKSIHQYLLLKADNREALTQNKNILQAEIENSHRMFKQCVALYRDDIIAFLASIYRKS